MSGRRRTRPTRSYDVVDDMPPPHASASSKGKNKRAGGRQKNISTVTPKSVTAAASFALCYSYLSRSLGLSFQLSRELSR